MISLKKFLIINFISLLILIYFFYIFYYLFFIQKSYIPISLIENISFCLFFLTAIIIVIGVYLLSISSENNNRVKIIKIKILSEKNLKLICIILFSLTFLIKRGNYRLLVIDWQNINIIDYIRAYIVLIICSFLPGAILYELFFSNLQLHRKFKLNVIIFKASIYPLLSFAFLGFSTLILDNLGLIRDYFLLVFYFLLIGLFFIDFIIQFKRNSSINSMITTVKITKYDILVLIIGIVISSLALLIHFSVEYLIDPDSWAGNMPAKFIGTPDGSPIDWGFKKNYPMFWGYIIYSLSILCGLPIINTNALLAPFCYLYVGSIYMLNKAILYNVDEKYAILSTYFTVFFSNLFINVFFMDTTLKGTSYLIFVCAFYFFYKSYAFYCLFFSLSIIIMISNTTILNTHKYYLFKKQTLKIIIIGMFFLIISFSIYIITLYGFLIIYSINFLVSKKKYKHLKISLNIILVFLTVYIIFDILMRFLLSYLIFFKVFFFFSFIAMSNNIPLYLQAILLYSILTGLLIINFLMIQFYPKLMLKKNPIRFRIKYKKIYTITILIFTLFLIIEIYSIVIETFFIDYYLSEEYFLYFYLDNLFLQIGFIGILAVYLSYFCYKFKKKTYFFLVFWIIITLLTASTLILKSFFFDYPFESPKDIPQEAYFYMDYWYRLIWLFSIPAFSILGSIGIIEFMKFLSEKRTLFKNTLFKNMLNKLTKYFVIILIISLAIPNFFISSLFWDSGKIRMTDEQAQVIGWISENIPEKSEIIIEKSLDSRGHFRRNIFEASNSLIYYLSDLFEQGFENKSDIECQRKLDYLIEKKIKYAILYDEEEYRQKYGDMIRDNNITYFIDNYLIPEYYNNKLYEYGYITIYSINS